MNPPPADSPKSQATEKAELLPCPWCGRAPRHYIEYGIVTLGCSNTKCHMMPVTAPKLSMETAVEFWNRRCAPPSNATLLASLKDMQTSAEKLLLTVGWGNMRASERQAFNDASLRADIAIAQAEAGQ